MNLYSMKLWIFLNRDLEKSDMAQQHSEQRIIKGISGSPGICMGKAHVVEKEGVNVIQRYHIDESMVETEIDRFKDAVTKAQNAHAQIVESLDKNLEDAPNILEAHMLLFKDKMLYDQCIEIIEKERINAEWVLQRVSRKIKRMFQQLDDTYLQARGNDIVQVADKIMSFLMGAHSTDISEIDKRVILVARDLSPADASQIHLDRIQGFITDTGGKDSHISIVAKSLQIPSVLGLKKASQLISNDDLLIVDGSAGRIIINPDQDTLARYEAKMMKFASYQEALGRERHLPAVSLDGVAVNLLANVELVEEIAPAKGNGARGIGLFRTEFLYMDLNRFPTEEELFVSYREIAELSAPDVVTIRSLDINGDKVNPALDFVEEANPVLGLRAIRFCLENPEIFLTQIKAILRAGVFGNVHLLIPMISSLEEIIQTKRLIEKAREELDREGKEYSDSVPFGIMIEVPSAVIMADEMAKHVDFFSIGTNDLIQYSLAIDRGNWRVAHLYNPLNPAILKMIRMVCESARKNDIGLVMCGEMASDPLNIPILLWLGIRSFSMNAASIPVVNKFIRSIHLEENHQLIQKAMEQNDAEHLMGLIQETYKDVLPYPYI